MSIRDQMAPEFLERQALDLRSDEIPKNRGVLNWLEPQSSNSGHIHALPGVAGFN
jgi:hypothetical protein